MLVICCLNGRYPATVLKVRLWPFCDLPGRVENREKADVACQIELRLLQIKGDEKPNVRSHPSSFILHPSSFILHPSSFI
jgi:hypothetical protein